MFGLLKYHTIMKLKVIPSTKRFSGNPTVTIQQNKKIGFNKACNEYMNLEKDNYIAIAIDENSNIYLLPTTDKNYGSKLICLNGWFQIGVNNAVEELGIKHKDKFKVIKIDDPDNGTVFLLEPLTTS